MAEQRREVPTPWKEAFLAMGWTARKDTPSMRAAAEAMGLNVTQVVRAIFGTENGSRVADTTVDKMVAAMLPYLISPDLPEDHRKATPRETLLAWIDVNVDLKVRTAVRPEILKAIETLGDRPELLGAVQTLHNRPEILQVVQALHERPRVLKVVQALGEHPVSTKVLACLDRQDVVASELLEVMEWYVAADSIDRVDMLHQARQAKLRPPTPRAALP
ncbi:hypothetical protein [Nocardia sp. NPDC050435]|uniref:hypothetical protein n=1 Tax=Nocardia sp. NPDC050435 TaxID=3155040 RepID=UPI0033CDC793